MPTPTPGSPTYHTNIALPAGADPQNRASFATPLSELADRTAYLRARLNAGGDEFVYAATKTRKKVINAAAAMLDINGSGVVNWFSTYGSGVHYLKPRGDAAFAVVPFALPSGCTVTDVDLLTMADSARTGTNRWGLAVYKQTSPWSSPAVPTATQQGSTVYAGTGSGYSLAALSGLTALIAAEETMHAIVLGPTGSIGNNDRFLALRVTFTDGGPRNA